MKALEQLHVAVLELKKIYDEEGPDADPAIVIVIEKDGDPSPRMMAYAAAENYLRAVATILDRMNAMEPTECPACKASRKVASVAAVAMTTAMAEADPDAKHTRH